MSLLADSFAAGLERGAMRGKGWRQAPFPGPLDLLMKLDKTYIETPALRLLSDELVAAAARRETQVNAPYLAISAPPQEGKSNLIARAFPLWLLMRDPDLRILVISYDDGSSVRWGRALKNALKSHSGVEPMNGMRTNLSLKPGSEAVNQLELDGHGGGLFCMSLVGGITGKAADCLVGNTEAITPAGRFTIREIYRAHLSGQPQHVLSWNADTGAAEFRPVDAVRRIPDREIVEIVTAAGRVIRCTPEHRVHTPDGYREAALLQPGDVVTVRRSEHDAGVCDLRDGPQERFADVPGMLAQGARREVRGPDLRPVRSGVPEVGGRAREAHPPGEGRALLQSQVPWRFDAFTRSSLPPLREADRLEGQEAALLLGGVPNRREVCSDYVRLRALHAGVPSTQCKVEVLRHGLQERRPLGGHDRAGERSLQGRNELRALVPEHAPADSGARREAVPRLRCGGQTHDATAGGAPHQRETLGERSGELDRPLPDLPCGPSQIGTDTVSVVRRVRDERHAVYDLEVAHNRNFFAGEVLVHNCIILDDVVKDRRTARSSAFKALWREQWQTAITSRLSARSLVVMDHTRWLSDDPIGQQLAEHGNRWRYVNIPAIVEDRPAGPGEAAVPVKDPLGRGVGEWLSSARKRSPEEWLQKRADVGEPDFWALYQGAPFPATGALFNVNHFRFWQATGDPWTIEIPNRPGPHEDLRTAMRFITVDLAASKRTSADYTVAAAWAIAGTGELLLLDLRRVQVEPASHWDEAVGPLYAYWRCPVYVEGSQYSTDLVYQATLEGAVVESLDADVDKYTRAIPAARRLKQGQILFPPGAHWMPDFRSELKEFPTGAHDDQVDVLSYAHRVRGAIWTPPPPPPAPTRRQDPLDVQAFGGVVADIASAPL